jgi:hypothetical protein
LSICAFADATAPFSSLRSSATARLLGLDAGGGAGAIRAGSAAAGAIGKSGPRVCTSIGSIRFTGSGERAAIRAAVAIGGGRVRSTTLDASDGTGSTAGAMGTACVGGGCGAFSGATATRAPAAAMA